MKLLMSVAGDTYPIPQGVRSLWVRSVMAGVGDASGKIAGLPQ